MKRKILNRPCLMAFFSGVLSFIAVSHMVFLLAWFSYVFFFFALTAKTIRQSLVLGFIFGLGISLPAFYWMISGIGKYTGLSEIYGLGMFFVASIVFCIYWCSLSISFHLLRISLKYQVLTSVLNALLMASIITLGEFALKAVFSGMPWFNYDTGTGVLKNLYAVQPASLFGLSGISFIIVFVNFLISEFIICAKWRNLIFTILIVPSYLFLGNFIYAGFSNKHTTKPIRIALISENFPPETKWASNNGNRLVNILFDLEKEALKLKPQLMLWSESTIPWTYRADDDFVKEVLRISSGAQVSHVIGMNTDYTKTQVYNSVYSLLPNGEVSGRYDKRFLLDFIENPVCNYSVPFLSTDGSSVKAGSNCNPVATSFGKAGIMICNEVVLENSAMEMSQNGAQFFLTLSNDGWFRDSYIVGLHFYLIRLRAVECRKDIAVNCNDGISGMLDASGVIRVQTQRPVPFVKVVNVYPNDYKTCTGGLRKAFLFLLILLIMSVLILKICFKALNDKCIY